VRRKHITARYMNSALGEWSTDGLEREITTLHEQRRVVIRDTLSDSLTTIELPYEMFQSHMPHDSALFVSVILCFPMSISHEISGSLVSCISVTVRELTLTLYRAS
jgi:hypothetical protein